MGALYRLYITRVSRSSRFSVTAHTHTHTHHTHHTHTSTYQSAPCFLPTCCLQPPLTSLYECLTLTSAAALCCGVHSRCCGDLREHVEPPVCGCGVCLQLVDCGETLRPCLKSTLHQVSKSPAAATLVPSPSSHASAVTAWQPAVTTADYPHL